MMIGKKCIQLDNVRMIQETLNFDFTYHLCDKFLVNVELIDSFDGTCKACLLVLGNEDFPKLTRPEFFA